MLEASLQAARMLDVGGDGSNDFRRVTAGDLEDQVAQTTYGPVAQATTKIVGFSAESATRIVFVIQETSHQWDCLAIDDIGGTASPVTGSAPSR